MTDEPETNTLASDNWADAMATLERDEGDITRAKAVVKRASDRRKANLKVFAERGIPTSILLTRYAESQMSEDERHQLYAKEAESRRALDLWSANSPEDFEALLQQAVATPPASYEHLETMHAERAFNDGYNSAKFGGHTETDNPHIQGTLKYVRWDAGCRKALNEMRIVELKPMADNQTVAVDKIADDIAKELDEKQSKPARKQTKREARQSTVANDDKPGSGLFNEDLPTPPGIPA